MNSLEEELRARIFLLEQEIEALRSVLSEVGEDKSHFVQMNKANAIQNVLDNLRKP